MRLSLTIITFLCFLLACDIMSQAQENIKENESPGKEVIREVCDQALDAWSRGDYEGSMKYYQKALSLSKYYGNKKYQSLALNNIGFLYAEYDRYEKTLEYYEKALDIRLEIDDQQGICFSYNNLGNVYFQTDSLDKALSFYMNALEIAREIKDSLSESNVLNNQGNVYLKKAQLKEALHSHQEALKIRIARQDLRGQAESFKNLSRIHIALKDFSSARKTIESGINLARKAKSLKLEKDLHYQSCLLFKQQERHSEALQAYLEYSNIKDSILSAESKNKIEELEIQYQTKEKEHKIKLLDARNKLKEEEIENQSWLIRLIVSILAVFIGMSIFLTILYLQKRRAHKTLVRYNVEAIESEKMESEDADQRTKYKGSTLDKTKKQDLLLKIETCFEEAKPYLKSDFNIEDLAKSLSSNRQYISQLINEHFSKNFSTFINEYRIKEARKLLIDPENQKYSIEGISEIVGFNSRSAFITSFKKYTGVTPSFFRNNYRNLQ